MKKRCIAAMIMLLGLLSSQSFAQSGFRIKGGVNFNGVSGDGISKLTKQDVGYHVGVAYEFSFNPFLGLEPGLFLDTRGFKISEEATVLGQTLKAEARTTVTYLNIPVALKGKIPLGEKSRIFALAGPFIGIGLKAKQTGEVIAPLVGKKEISADIKFGDGEEEYRPTITGLTFGGGFELGHFIISAGYDLGLSETFKESKNYFNALKVGVGVKF